MKNTSLLMLGLAALCAQPLAFAQTDSAQKGLPALIQVATANTLVLETKASGTIEYQCSKEKDPLTTYKWSMVGPKQLLCKSNHAVKLVALATYQQGFQCPIGSAA